MTRTYEEFNQARHSDNAVSKIAAVGFIGLGLANHYVANLDWSSPYVWGGGAGGAGAYIVGKILNHYTHNMESHALSQELDID